jgi:protein TonB
MPLLSLVPARRLPVPAAPIAALPSGTAPGLGFSVMAHAALVAAVVGGPRVAGGPPGAPAEAAPAARETLHWVGLDGGGPAGSAPRPAPRPGTRPPLAYYVPGPAGGRGAEPAGRGAGPAAGGPAAPAAPDAPRAAPARAALRRVAVPAIAIPEAEVAQLMAGVLAAVRDQARRASRPEDFLPSAPGGVLTQAGALAPVALLGPQAPLPIPLASNPVPEYPAALARAGVGARVVVEFLIDSTGAVNAQSLRVVESGGPAFADAVRRVLPRLRFVPGLLGERPVGVTVRQPFVFVARRGA